MNLVRVVLILVAIVIAAFVAFRGLRHEPPKVPPGTGTVPPATGTVAPAFNPLHAGAAPEGAAAAPKSPPPMPVADTAPRGTPVKEGAAVDVLVPYRAGTKSRYRVTDALLTHDRETDATQWVLWTWNVTTEVVRGDGTGPARIRFTLDGLRFGTDLPVRVEFDSEKPDKDLFANEGLARSLKPILATLGLPLEFEIAASGAARSVDGVSQVSRRYEDVLDQLGARVAREAPDVPSAESLLQHWGEILFPPIGGGSMKAGETRDLAFSRTMNERWLETAHGKLRVTHDDPDVFRVEFVGKEDAVEELNRPARHPTNAVIEKARVTASDDSYRASWRFDRKAGRLVEAHIDDTCRWDVSRRAPGSNNPMTPGFAPQFVDIQRLIAVELLER